MSDGPISKKINVKISLFPPFSKNTTKEETTMAFERGSTVKDVMDDLVRSHEQFKMYLGEIAGEEQTRLRVLIIHNDHIASLDEVVTDGDSLKFLHPLQGG